MLVQTNTSSPPGLFLSRVQMNPKLLTIVLWEQAAERKRLLFILCTPRGIGVAADRRIM